MVENGLKRAEKWPVFLLAIVILEQMQNTQYWNGICKLGVQGVFAQGQYSHLIFRIVVLKTVPYFWKHDVLITWICDYCTYFMMSSIKYAMKIQCSGTHKLDWPLQGITIWSHLSADQLWAAGQTRELWDPLQPELFYDVLEMNQITVLMIKNNSAIK